MNVEHTDILVALYFNLGFSQKDIALLGNVIPYQSR